MTESKPPRRRLFGSTPASPPNENDSVPFAVRLAAAWSWRLLLIAASTALVVWLVIQLRIIIIPVLVALLIAALLVPFVSFLTRHGWPKWLSVTVAMVGTIAFVTGLLTIGIMAIVRGSQDLAAQTQLAWKDFQEYLLDSPFHVTRDQLTQFFEQLVGVAQSESGVLINGALSLGATVGHVVAGALLVLFTTLIFLIDGKGIWHWVVRIFPRRAQDAVYGAGCAGWGTLTSFVRVQILVATIDAIGIGLGAFFLGVPLALPIGILVFLGSFIPIVGAIVTGALAAFVALVFNGPVIALFMLIIVLVVHQVEGHVLQPLIMGTAVRVHPLAVVLAVATGSFLAGIPGALFAVPVAATANVIINYISSGAWKPGGPKPPSFDPMWSTVPQRRPGYQATSQGITIERNPSE